MGFKETVMFMMNMVKKSLQTELNDFFERVMKKDYAVTKNAYTQARKKIKPELFIELIDGNNELIYNQKYKTWNGYRLSAIDGTCLELPNTEELRKEFGESKNQVSAAAMAKASCIYDIENHIVIKCIIDKYTASERTLAIKMMKDALKSRREKELVLFDRGYPSAEMIAFMMDNKLDFVMRCPRKFSKVVESATQSDQIIQIPYTKKTYEVRVVRFMLDSGEEEILLTSLMSKELTVDDFKGLYFKRWKIEIKYDEVKNKLEIENFTGTSKIAVEQDFYASMFISNMVELARTANDEELQTKNKENGKKLKYEYKTNLNMLIGALKDKLILMLTEKSPRKRRKMFKRIQQAIKTGVIPIRPGRHNIRKKKKSSRKYSNNRKRSL